MTDSLTDPDRGVCPCGHEITESGACLVWVGDQAHEVLHWSALCICHGVDVIAAKAKP